MIYISSPYTHNDPLIMEQRYNEAAAYAASLLRGGTHCISPIVHCHPLVKYGLPVEYSFWKKYNRALIKMCTNVHVLMIDGWGLSVGVSDEMAYAYRCDIPITFVEMWK